MKKSLFAAALLSLALAACGGADKAAETAASAASEAAASATEAAASATEAAASAASELLNNILLNIRKSQDTYCVSCFLHFSHFPSRLFRLTAMHLHDRFAEFLSVSETSKPLRPC